MALICYKRVNRSSSEDDVTVVTMFSGSSYNLFFILHMKQAKIISNVAVKWILFEAILKFVGEFMDWEISLKSIQFESSLCDAVLKKSTAV